jgi:hypothetical protein
MKKIVSLLLALTLLTNVACLHTQTTPTTSPLPGNSNTLDASTVDASEDAAIDNFYVELGPLPSPQPLPQLRTDGGFGPNGEALAPLRADAHAPFNGILLNIPALAHIEVEYRAVQQRCLIDRRRETELVAARYQAQLERLQVSLDSLSSQHRIVLQGRDREITSLNRIITDQRNASTITPLQAMLYVGGGLLVGTIITGTTVYIVTR